MRLAVEMWFISLFQTDSLTMSLEVSLVVQICYHLPNTSKLAGGSEKTQVDRRREQGMAEVAVHCRAF